MKKKKGLLQVLIGVLLICAMLVPAFPALAAGVNMYIDPATKTVNAGESFTVSIYIDTDTASRGAQCDIAFDPSLVRVDSRSYGL